MPQLAPIGHNDPPSLFDFARETMDVMSHWMSERPAINNEADAREAKLLLDRAKNCSAEIEAERDKLVRPLNEQIDTINTKYKTFHNKDAKKPGLLDKIANELKSRLSLFIKAEEDRRLHEAECKRRAAAEAERLAREAETREREAIANAKAGELGIDVTQVVVQADSRFAEFKKADREATRAERETHVKIGGGWGNAASLRTKETLVLNDAFKALAVIGITENIETAILSAARDYRRLHKVLPAGVSALTERCI